MSIVFERRAHPLGTHRVLEPDGAMPQSAWKLDNTPVALENEILCDVETLNIDSASFKQISDECGGDADKISAHIAGIIRERGKQHNPVTGSGGMFIGHVLKIGESLRSKIDLKAGDRIASLVSLTLTPLLVEAVTRIDVATGRVWIRGKAILFESGLWAKLPNDIDENVALAVLDVAGAPAQVKRLCGEGQTVVVIGADGKSGVLSCAQARARVGTSGRVIGIVPDDQTPSAQAAAEHGIGRRTHRRGRPERARYFARRLRPPPQSWPTSRSTASTFRARSSDRSLPPRRTARSTSFRCPRRSRPPHSAPKASAKTSP